MTTDSGARDENTGELQARRPPERVRRSPVETPKPSVTSARRPAHRPQGTPAAAATSASAPRHTSPGRPCTGTAPGRACPHVRAVEADRDRLRRRPRATVPAVPTLGTRGKAPSRTPDGSVGSDGPVTELVDGPVAAESDGSGRAGRAATAVPVGSGGVHRRARGRRRVVRRSRSNRHVTGPTGRHWTTWSTARRWPVCRSCTCSAAPRAGPTRTHGTRAGLPANAWTCRFDRDGRPFEIWWNTRGHGDGAGRALGGRTARRGEDDVAAGNELTVTGSPALVR